MIKLLKANEENLNGVLALCILAHQEFSSVSPSFNLQKCTDTWLGLIQAGNVCILVNDEIKTDEDLPLAIGVMGTKKTDFWYSTDEAMVEVLLYVAAAYRNINNARRLVKAQMQLAKIKKLPLWIGQTSGYHIKSMEELYKRMGFTIRGCTGVYRP